MTPDDYFAYLEQLAINRVGIAHRDNNPRYAEPDLLGNFAGNQLRLQDGPCLVALSPKYTGTGDNFDVNGQRMVWNFQVVQHFEPTLTPGEVRTRMNHLYQEAMKFLSWIRRDQANLNPVLTGLLLERHQLYPCRSGYDNARGWEVSIPHDLDAGDLLVCDPDDWEIPVP